MQNVMLIVVVAALVAWMIFRSKWKSSSPSGQAGEKLRRLSEAYNSKGGSPEDLAAWEQALAVMEQHPSDYNKLNGDIHFIGAFTGYLEKHYPEDERLEALRQHAHYRKDSIWGIPIKRDH
jgi:hypothetical protein